MRHARLKGYVQHLITSCEINARDYSSEDTSIKRAFSRLTNLGVLLVLQAQKLRRNQRLTDFIQEYLYQILYAFKKYLSDSLEKKNPIKIFIKLTLFRNQRGRKTEETFEQFTNLQFQVTSAVFIPDGNVFTWTVCITLWNDLACNS